MPTAASFVGHFSFLLPLGSFEIACSLSVEAGAVWIASS